MGGRLQATLFHIHVYTHAHRRAYAPRNSVRASPCIQTVGQTLSQENCLSLSCLFSISPSICHCSNEGLGQRARKRWFLGSDSSGRMFMALAPQPLGEWSQEGGRKNVSVRRYSSVRGELFQRGEAKKNQPVWREKGMRKGRGIPSSGRWVP